MIHSNTNSLPPIHQLVHPGTNSTSQTSPFAYPRQEDAAVIEARIMVIDDEESTTMAIKRMLNEVGFTNIQCHSESESAFEAIQQSLPDLILLDLMMPVSGVQILRKIQENPATNHISVLSLTANEDAHTRAEVLNLGANDFLNKPVCPNELVARVRNCLTTKLAFDKLASHSKQLEADILTDPLTKVANRRAFDFELDRKIIEWERQRTPFSLLILDIDYFKSINDDYGHYAGDRILERVAANLKRTTRRMDLVCRVGGEEFAVILPVTRNCESNQTAERIRRAIEEESFDANRHPVSLTVSVGIANAMKGDDTTLLYNRADAALYASKQRGRNCCTLHDGVKCEPVSTLRDDLSSRVQTSDSAEVNINASQVLIVDDEPSTAMVVEKYLKSGGFQNIHALSDPTKAMTFISENKPDLVLLDIHMPEIDGMQILQQMRQTKQLQQITVIFLTSATDTETKVHALNRGANDFLSKPVNSSELLARVRNTLMAKAHVNLLASYSEKLEKQVHQRTLELLASRREAIQCLARAAEIRDDQTGQHVIRVGRYAAIIAEALGFSQQQVDDLEHAAQLHDVGKIGVPDAILNKADKLTDEEFDQIKDHCRTGSLIMSEHDSIDDRDGHSIGKILEQCTSPVMRLAALVAETHHEKWNGSGYPRGLAGEEIPVEGRITAVADVFDALSSERPYKPAFPLEKCFQIIAEGSGSHFDPAIVEAFFSSHMAIIETFKKYQQN